MRNICSLILFTAILVSCADESHELNYSDQEKKSIDSMVFANRNVDSLAVLSDRYAAENNILGQIVALRELGRCYRNSSSFTEANVVHKQALELACEYKDTMHIVRILNDIGTNFRRMGILDEASDYHYKALTYCDAYSVKDHPVALKNRVITLNGIGNVQLTLKNNEVAHSVFRMALEGERALGSPVGQAINYANIGALFEDEGQIDSARWYYERSMEMNVKAGSVLGISLCHNHFGRLAENAKDYGTAIKQYKEAYDLMCGKSDIWHWLESCLALSRVHLADGNVSESRMYLARAAKAAHSIGSLEHLVEVHRVEYLIHKSTGDWKKALSAYVASQEYRDSLSNEKNLTHMQNARIRYEQEKKRSEIDRINYIHEIENGRNNRIIGSAVVALVSAVIAIIFLIHILRLRSKNQEMMKEVERTRTNFFTNITHEFRTPLTVIISAAQDLLSKAKGDKLLQRNTSDIIRHGKGLLDLVNQILDIAKISSGVAATPAWTRGDVIGFISMICESYLQYAQRKDLKLVYGFDKDRLEMDFIPAYMSRIVQNLLSNAIKFSYPGADVLVSVKTFSTGEGRYMSLYVCDTGMGMTEEQKSNIFKPFFQAYDDTKNIGSGIGLSLVKLTAEAMGGKVEVHSYPSEGSVFIVTLPLQQHDVAEIESVDSSEYRIDSIDVSEHCILEDECNLNGDTPRVLIVEDTPEVARWQMRQLNPEYSFYFAADGREGLQKAEEIVPDIIITDVMMPVMDGYELCGEVRRNELLCHIPVIMVTAKATPEDRLRGLNAGADAYMEKPFNPDELAVRVVKLLEQREMLRRKFSETQAEDGAIISEMSFSDKAFVERLSTAIHDLIIKGKIDYDELASAFFVGKTQLNRKIKAVTGYTTTEYILQIRVSMAKQLLVKTDLSIGEIASRVGIDDVAYFSSIFRKATGKTPTAYRNR